jgi:hypothetical protein
MRRGKSLRVAVVRAGRFRTTLAPGCGGCLNAVQAGDGLSPLPPAPHDQQQTAQYLAVYNLPTEGHQLDREPISAE